ncbi:hypothetical protein C8R45DRAFT_1208676 [Mycena sanguinolenta]|nr:hypothetical protein C8R45DRAFT_1208676 [Mycena sanguinolenta]
MDTGRPTVPPILRMFDGVLRHIQAEAGIPSQPGENPGVSVTFSLEVHIIGLDSSGQKRTLEITFDVVKIGWYEMYQQTEIETLYCEFVEKIGPELTHNSNEWVCRECGLPANDIAWMSMYTTQLHRRCTVLISPGCRKCARRMERGALRVSEGIQNRRSADDDTAINIITRPSALSGGFSSTCLTCRKPATGMLRCGNCKLVRYCSADCQKKDWARHKTICRTIHFQAVSRTCDDAKIRAVTKTDDGIAIQAAPRTSDEAKEEGGRVSWYRKYLPRILRRFRFSTRSRGTSRPAM